jgi:hypothetical protein
MTSGCGLFGEPLVPSAFAVHFHNTCSHAVQVGYRDEFPEGFPGAPEQPPFKTTLVNPGETERAVIVRCHVDSSFFDSAYEWTSKCVQGTLGITVQISANGNQRTFNKMEFLKLLENSTNFKNNDGHYVWTISNPSLCPTKSTNRPDTEPSP